MKLIEQVLQVLYVWNSGNKKSFGNQSDANRLGVWFGAIFRQVQLLSLWQIHLRILQKKNKLDISGVVSKSKDEHVALIDGSHVGEICRTFEGALTLYCREMQKRGIFIDHRTVMAFEYLPEEKVYKFLRVRWTCFWNLI